MEGIESDSSSSLLEPLRESGFVDDDDVLINWEPMNEDFQSVQNLIRVDQNDPLGFNLAVGGNRVTTLQETPCQFYTGRGDFCWKGSNCPYKHEKGTHTTESNFIKVGTEACRYLGSLDEKPFAVKGGVIPVTVTHIVNPAEFYVMPQANWECLCEKYSSKKKEFARKVANAVAVDENGVAHFGVTEEELEHERMNKKQAEIEAYESLITYGKVIYDKLMVGLNKYLTEFMTWRKLQTTAYELLELVAVRVEEPTEKPVKKTWARGVILETDVENAIDREIPWFTVQLIDQGPILTVSAGDLCKLPPAFCFTPGLVQKCFLDGVVPVRFTWPKSSIEMFKELSMNKPLWLTVVKTPLEIRPNLLDQKALNKEIPYLVTLTFEKTKDKKRVNVARKLADAGKAVALNSFPFRPKVQEVIKHLDTSNPFLSKFHCTHPLPTATLNGERERIYENRNFIDDVDKKPEFKREATHTKEDVKFSQFSKALQDSISKLKPKESQTNGRIKVDLPDSLLKSGISSRNGIKAQPCLENLTTHLDKINITPTSHAEYSRAVSKTSIRKNEKKDATMGAEAFPSTSSFAQSPKSDTISFGESARIYNRKQTAVPQVPSPLSNLEKSTFDYVSKILQGIKEGSGLAGSPRPSENHSSKIEKSETDNSRVQKWVETTSRYAKVGSIKKKGTKNPK